MTYIYLMYRKNGNDGVEFSKKSYYSFMGIKKPQLKKQADIILGDILEKYSNAIINIVDLSLNDLINIKLNVVDSKKKFKELHPEKNVFKFAKIYFDEIDLIIEQEKKSELSVSAKKIFLFLSYHRLKMIKRNGALVETAPEISYFRINDLSEQINISMRTISRMLKILSDIKIIKTNQTKTLKIPDTTFFIKGYIIVADYHSRDIKYSAEENLKYGVEYVNNKLNERRKL
ncbi:hypothetical protein CWE04_11715 [Thomasclavelia cocleata]|nr:hypothetical protein CWE04_11715 [Thomasclavelia cocleata]